MLDPSSRLEAFAGRSGVCDLPEFLKRDHGRVTLGPLPISEDPKQLCYSGFWSQQSRSRVARTLQDMSVE